MKGVIFNIFEEFVTANWGAETYEDILDLCPQTAGMHFVGPRTYPDEYLVAMLGKACETLSVTPDVALRSFGGFAFGALVGRYPVFLEGVDHPRQLLLALNDIIHVEVKKLMEGAVPPTLRYEVDESDDTRLTIHYQSERGLCHLMEGLIDGAAEHFGVPIEHEQVSCKHNGAECCIFAVRFLQPVIAA
jgi:hypothetical protein